MLFQSQQSRHKQRNTYIHISVYVKFKIFGTEWGLTTIKIHSFIHVVLYWGWMTHVCVNKLTIIGSDIGLSPSRRQNIIWTDDIVIRNLGPNFSEFLSKIHSTFIHENAFENVACELAASLSRPQCVNRSGFMCYICPYNPGLFHYH